jgi:hypothetical protein
MTQSSNHLAHQYVASGGYSRRMRSTMAKAMKARLISLACDAVLLFGSGLSLNDRE